ncbi:MAG: hypothetical protein KDE33_13710 [Bacteroidetes bacterium]|nr:hypothetical protein [Bacteroidota bacterium]MCB9226023.1 hypothetical protein [Chitinophagales bacterium]
MSNNNTTRKKLRFFEIDILGLSSKTTNNEKRIVNKDGSFNIERKGEKIHIYHFLTNISWKMFFFIILVLFTLINGMFSLLYYIVGTEYISNFTSQNFILDIINLFHFSVQTMTTVGYGAMHPTGIISGILASVEALLGLMTFAIIAGLVYGRFSKPQSEIIYSKNILITEFEEKKVMQIRIANNLSNDLFDIEGKILMIHNEKNEEGSFVKRYHSLPLVYDKINFMPMSWTLTHIIDEESPLFNLSQEEMTANKTEFVVIITSFDDSYSQLVHSKTSYLCRDIVYEGNWASVFTINENGVRTFDLNKVDLILHNEQA